MSRNFCTLLLTHAAQAPLSTALECMRALLLNLRYDVTAANFADASGVGAATLNLEH